MSLFVHHAASVCDFPGPDSWVILSPVEQSIKRKIEAVGTPLKDWDINIYRGVLTGYNDAFIITTERRDAILAACQGDDERRRTEELIRPILRGRDIKRYGYEWAGLWLIYIPWHFPYQFDETITGASEKAEKAFEEQYPAVYAHMLKYKDPLSKRNKSETGIRYEWYAMQRWGAKYWGDFLKPKIVYQELSRTGCSFMLDEKQHMVSNSAYMITIDGDNVDDLLYLLAFLNSRVLLYCLDKETTRFDNNGWRWLRQFIELLRVPMFSRKEDVLRVIKTSKFENVEEINAVVSDVYGLSQEERTYINNLFKSY